MRGRHGTDAVRFGCLLSCRPLAAERFFPCGLPEFPRLRARPLPGGVTFPVRGKSPKAHQGTFRKVPWTFRARGPAAKRWARVQPSSRPRKPIAPRWIPPHMLPGTVILWRTPVPRLPEGGSNGGNRRAVSPLAVGEGFQRGPPIPSMIAPKPLASGRRGGAIEHLRVFPALSLTGKTMPARFATTKVPFGGFFCHFLWQQRKWPAGGK